MAKRKSKQERAKRKSTGLVPRGEPLAMDKVDGVRVGESPPGVPRMKLRCARRGHTRTVGWVTWSPRKRFIASPFEGKTIHVWDANNGSA